MEPEETQVCVGPPVNDIKWLLTECARALDENKLHDFDILVEHTRGVVCITGDPIQRLGAYMIEGLVARKEASGRNICRALRCHEPAGTMRDLLSYMHVLYETWPYLKFGCMAANGAIARACRGDDRIHIIDFQVGHGSQWMTLLQAFATRPGGAPYVRITGIQDPLSSYSTHGVGDPIQRLGAYMIEGLVARKEASGRNICRALRCHEPAGTMRDLLSYMHVLYETWPYLKFGCMAANGAIARACRGDDRIHIIDFQVGHGSQWMTLLQALATRPGGAPYVRITGIQDPLSSYSTHGVGSVVGERLAAMSERFNIPVEFHNVPVFASLITRDMLGIRPGECLAVNFPLQLHKTPDESVDVTNPRDRLLRMVKSLSPRVVTLVEQESNTNTAPFFPRFREAMDYYSAMFESLDVVPGMNTTHTRERIIVEQHCLARDLVNIIACEGKEREERHEMFGKWKSRFTMAGFRQLPLSPYVNSVIKDLLGTYSQHYTLVEEDGAMLLGWKERNLISTSAWH
ncbi:unnamed protein product [Cuscuta campestris]|uniref:Uncharacterized protein n=1 Tax=Cuscuta campestris TaxID=132261 RepID=A0A484M3F6_9ASTE|nr:unnamed protein product [Cuscuta campestris]